MSKRHLLDGKEEDQKEETTDERVARIKKTEVTLSDFFNQCLDFEMLKLFFGFLFVFFCTVGLATIFYLFFIFLFKKKMWNFYFGSHDAHEEL